MHFRTEQKKETKTLENLNSPIFERDQTVNFLASNPLKRVYLLMRLS